MVTFIIIILCYHILKKDNLKIIKIINSILIPILIILLIIPICFPCTTYAMSEIISQGDDFIGQGGTDTIDKDALNTTSKYIYNVLFTIAVVIAFAIGIIIGIQFIVGSVDEKAKIKEKLQ